jgi:hypothetical protein
VLKGTEPLIALEGQAIKVWYSDEHALALGIRSVNGVPFVPGVTAFDVTGAPCGHRSR